MIEGRGGVGHSRSSLDGREEEREIGAWRKREMCAKDSSSYNLGSHKRALRDARFYSACDPTLHRRAVNADAGTVESAGKSRHANHTGSYVCRPAQTKGTVGIGIELAARLIEPRPERLRRLIRWHREKAMIRGIEWTLKCHCERARKRMKLTKEGHTSSWLLRETLRDEPRSGYG